MNLESPRNLFVSTVVINGLVPFLAYHVLADYMHGTAALTIAVCLPLGYNLYRFWRGKTVDPFGAFILFGVILGMVAALLGGSEKLILLRESLVTAVVGTSFLVSLLFPKPLILLFARRFVAEDAIYQHISQPQYRRFFRWPTLVWGVALTGEAAVKIYLVFILSTGAFLLVSPVITYGCITLTAAWTFWFFRNLKQKKAFS